MVGTEATHSAMTSHKPRCRLFKAAIPRLASITAAGKLKIMYR